MNKKLHAAAARLLTNSITCDTFNSGSFGPVAQLGERTVRIRKVDGSIPFRSTKQGSDEHLLFQWRFRREVFALIHNRKAPSWE